MHLLFFVIFEEVPRDAYCFGISWWDLDSDVILACCVKELERLTRVLRALLPSLSLLERNDLPTTHDHSGCIVLFAKGSSPSFFACHRFLLQQRHPPYVVDLHVYQRDCSLPVIFTSLPDLPTPSLAIIHTTPKQIIFLYLLLGLLHDRLSFFLTETIILSLERTV